MICGSRSIAALAALPLVVGASACRQRKTEQKTSAAMHIQSTGQVAPIAPGSPSVAPSASLRPLASNVPLGDPSFAGQLVKGFYAIENQSWRWTAGDFSVRLAIPDGAREKGALLRLKFSVPKPVLDQHSSFVLTAKVGETQSTSKYSKPGDYVFDLDIQPAALSGDSVLAEFRIDKPFRPGGTDVRVLGVVALSIELSVKS